MLFSVLLSCVSLIKFLFEIVEFMFFTGQISCHSKTEIVVFSKIAKFMFCWYFIWYNFSFSVLHDKMFDISLCMIHYHIWSLWKYWNCHKICLTKEFSFPFWKLTYHSQFFLFFTGMYEKIKYIIYFKYSYMSNTVVQPELGSRFFLYLLIVSSVVTTYLNHWLIKSIF